MKGKLDNGKKRKREKENNVGIENTFQINPEVLVRKKKKEKSLTNGKGQSKIKKRTAQHDEVDAYDKDGSHEQNDYAIIIRKKKKGKPLANRKEEIKVKNLSAQNVEIDMNRNDGSHEQNDDGILVRKKKKGKSSRNRKGKIEVKNTDVQHVGTDEFARDGSQEQKDDMVDKFHPETQGIEECELPKDDDVVSKSMSKKARKNKKKGDNSSKEEEKSFEKEVEADQSEIYYISSGDEDYSKGMKKWITENHKKRLDLKELQQKIDDFITAHEAQLEQERKQREARAAEGEWTVVEHHKGRKKTTEAETGIAVGSVAKAAVEDRMTKKNPKEVGLDFYRFQRREAQRNELMMLQKGFEEDKKRIQQLRASRKFRPY